MQRGESSSSHRGALSLLTPIGASYYARSKALDTKHYQKLMDRGWRRSGTLLYLPDASRSCCPHYTIRLPASEFNPSRDQRQTLNRWNRYVLGEKYIAEAKLRFPKSKEEKKRQDTTFDLVSTVGESEVENLKPGITPDHRFEITLEPDRFSKEKFALFDDYQRHVHHEGDGDISEAGFKRFLCSSPLARTTTADGVRYGSFHQCYRLDGRLIAMAVLDLLPHAVSGVYFIYHHDFSRWSFGKLSALRETALALSHGYEYYYMGYYIHNCPKMRYKGDFRPQYVLDYHTLEWDVLDDAMRRLMDRRKYASMSRERARRQARGPAAGASPRPVGESNSGVGDDPHEAENPPNMPDDDDDDDGDAGDASMREAEDDDATDDAVLYPEPLQATASELSILQLHVPGVMDVEQLREKVDLDSMKIYLGPDGVYEARNITIWKSGTELDPDSLKGKFAEFAAAVGPEVAREAYMDYSA